jgi:hypothetical protein
VARRIIWQKEKKQKIEKEINFVKPAIRKSMHGAKRSAHDVGNL